MAKPTTTAEREMLTDLRQAFTVAEYNYLLEGTEDLLVIYRQAREAYLASVAKT